MKRVNLQARCPGGEWGTRSRMEEENAKMSLPPFSKGHMTREQV